MSEYLNIIKEMISRLLADGVDGPLLEAAEAGAWAAPLWAQLEENGLTEMLADPGGEAGWCEAFPVIEAAGHHGLPLPLPEAIAASRLLGLAGLEPPAGVTGLAGCHRLDDITLTKGAEGWQVEGTAHRVPWARSLNHLVVAIDGQIACLPLDGCALRQGANLAGEPRDDVSFAGQAAMVAEVSGDLDIQKLGAALRSAQMAGAIASLLAQSVTFAKERQQFGRSIGNFQAVQQQLAVLAEESAAATLAAEYAFATLDGAGDSALAVAVAKIRCGEAAGKACAIAHQVHGAMGFAYETPLHHITRRLLAWRAEFGAEGDWALQVAARVVPQGGDGLWPFIVENQEGVSS